MIIRPVSQNGTGLVCVGGERNAVCMESVARL